MQVKNEIQIYIEIDTIYYYNNDINGWTTTFANGDPIDMKTMLEKYPVKLTSVKEYAKSMVAVL